MAEGSPENANRELIDAIYQHAFPDESQPSWFTDSRQYLIAERLGLHEPVKPTELKAFIDSHLPGHDRAMVDLLRRRSLAELLLYLDYALRSIVGDFKRSLAVPLPETATDSFSRRTSEASGYQLHPLSTGFNRALAQLDADAAAIDAAILAVTGKEPHRGRSR